MRPPIYWDSYAAWQDYGGIASYARRLQPALAQQGWAVKRLSAAKPWRSWKLVWPNLVAPPPNIISCPYIFHGLANINLPIWGKRPSNAAYVLTVHDLIPAFPDSGVSTSLRTQFRLALPRVLKRADRIICISTWTQATLQDRYPDVAERIRLIPHGHPHPSPLSEFDTDPCMLLSVSRYEAYKGFELLLELLKALPKEFHLVLVTDKNGAAFLKYRIYGLRDRIKILQDVKPAELKKLYQRAQICLQPSRYEGWALPNWEAIAQGCPVLYRLGHAFTLTSGVAQGLSSDVDEWKEAVLTWRDKSRADIFRQAREVLARQSSWTDCANRVVRVYKELIR